MGADYNTATETGAEIENENKKEENEETGKINNAVNINELTDTKIYWKLVQLLMGSMIGVHHIAQLGENDKDQVLVTLAVDKGSKR